MQRPGRTADQRHAEHAEARAWMVERHLAARGIDDRAVLDAMGEVPREAFLPHELARFAYEDRPLPIGEDQTISQPYMVAVMAAAAGLGPTDRVLEVGTGSGYAAAVFSRIAADVYTVERHASLAAEAQVRFAELGYDNIHVAVRDGSLGWREHAPFDAIIVTAAAGRIPPPLVRQLKPGGRMVVPVGQPFAVQQLMLVQKDERGRVTTRQILPVRFVPLTGER